MNSLLLDGLGDFGLSEDHLKWLSNGKDILISKICFNCAALNRETGEEVAVKFESAKTKFP